MEALATLAENGPREWATEARRQFDRIPTYLLLVAPAIAFAVLVQITGSWALRGFAGDLELYRSYAFWADERTLGAAIRMEYPPLAMIPMVLPLVSVGAFPDAFGYLDRFVGIAALIAVAAGWALYRASGRDRLALATWAAMVALSWVSAALRFDLWPVALTLVAMLVARRHPGPAGILLGIGTMLKVYPFVLVGILGARALASREWGGTARLVAGWALVCVAVMGAAWSIGGPESLHWLSYQGDRGLQIESIGATFVLAAGLMGAHVQPVFAFGSTEIAGPGSDVLVALSTPMLGVLVAAAGLLSLRRFVAERRVRGAISMETLALACTAGITALLIGNKVLSLQYILWLAPFVPFLPWRFRLLALAMAGLSTWIFEADYAGVWEFRWWMVVAMIARNVLLLGFGALVVRALWRVERRTETDETGGRARTDRGHRALPAPHFPAPHLPVPHFPTPHLPVPHLPAPHLPSPHLPPVVHPVPVPASVRASGAVTTAASSGGGGYGQPGRRNPRVA